MLEPKESDIPTLFIILVFLPLATYFLLGKWGESRKRQNRASELAAQLAAEESSRSMYEIPAQMQYEMPVQIPYEMPVPVFVPVPVPVVPVPVTRPVYYECATCHAPATTRCSRCKSVRYCSGKCQIVHWRQGHKDRCQPYSASGNPNGQVSSPQRMPDLVNINSPVHSEPDQVSEGDININRNGSNNINSNNKEKKGTNGKLKQSKLRNEDLEASQVTEEVAKNTRTASITKNTLQNHKITKETRKRNKTTNSSPSPNKSNPEKNLEQTERGFSEKSAARGEDRGVSEKNTARGEDRGFSEKCAARGVEERVFSEKSAVRGVEERIFSEKSAVRGGEERVFSEKSAVREERGSFEKNSVRGGVFCKNPPYNSQSVCVVEKPQDYKVVNEHYFEGDEKNLLCKSRSTHANGATNHHSNEVSKKSEITKKPSKFLKYNLVGLINDNKKTKVPQMLFPYEELVKFFQYEVRGVSPRGLVNCGNSCYANAVLQCLTCTKPLMVYLLKRLHSQNCWAKNNWCLMCELEKHASILRENGGPLSLSKILNNMRNIDFRLGGGSQEDAHEFLRLLVMSMQSTCLESLGGEKSVDPKLQETTLIQQIFGGRLKSKVKCMRCYHESEIYENIMDLTLEIHGWVESLEDALTQFTSPEDLDGENMYRCERCSAYVRARKQLSVHEVPNILTIVLKRFQSGKYGKINKCVTFREVLDMVPFVTGTGDKPPLYQLYAVIVHLDNHNASFSGHYISYVKDMHGTWLKIDDSQVQVVQLNQVMSQGAYMLFYSRSFPRPPRVYTPDEKITSKPPKSSQIYDFRQNPGDQSGFASSAATDYSDANSSSEWSLFTSSDESSFTTESTRDSFSMVDYVENPNSNLNPNPNLDPFASIFGPVYYGGEYNNHANNASCRPQTRYYVEGSNVSKNYGYDNDNNSNGGVIRGRNVDLEGCYVQTSGYFEM